MRSWLDQRRQAYVLGVTAQLRLWTGQKREWASEVVRSWPDSKWQQLSCGAGSKGERVYEWAQMVIRKGDDGWQRWLLARRSLSDCNEVSYYVVGGPKQTTLEEMARVAGTRWAIEESFETGKGEVGLDQYEVRSWKGWYRHITLAMLAHAYLTVMRARAANEETGAEKKRGRGRRQKNCCR